MAKPAPVTHSAETVSAERIEQVRELVQKMEAAVLEIQRCTATPGSWRKVGEP